MKQLSLIAALLMSALSAQAGILKPQTLIHCQGFENPGYQMDLQIGPSVGQSKLLVDSWLANVIQSVNGLTTKQPVIVHEAYNTSRVIDGWSVKVWTWLVDGTAIELAQFGNTPLRAPLFTGTVTAPKTKAILHLSCKLN